MAEKQVAQGVFNSQERGEKGRTATQRGSLAQVNATLLAQTDVLRDTQKSVLATQGLLAKSLDAQFKAASMAKLKDLEAQREGGRFAKVAGGIGAAGGALRGGLEKGVGNLQGMLGKIGSFLTPAALAALPGILGGILLKRGIPALAVGIFADEIAEFLLGPEASGELKDQVARAIQGGAIGSLLGKKFALVGAAAGFLIDDEVAAQLLELGKSFGSLIGVDIKNMDDLKSTMISIGEFLRGSLKKGLEGINELLRGDIAGFLGIGEGEESNLLATLGTIGALGLVFAPSATFSVAGGLFKGSLKAISIAVGAIWKGVPAVLGALGLLGNNVVASAGTQAAGSGAKGLVGKAGGALLTLGRFGTMFAMGPAGAIVLAAGAGYAFTEWFKSTELGKDLMRMGEEASEKLNEGVEGMGPRELEETSVTQSEMGYEPPDPANVVPSQMKDMSIPQLEAKAAQHKMFMEAYAESSPSSAELHAKELAKTEEAIRGKKATAFREREAMMSGVGPSSGAALQQQQQTYQDAIMRKSQPMIVDGSTNTTNNIGQSNTTLSAPPPSAGQRDDYSNALQSRGDDLMMSAAG